MPEIVAKIEINLDSDGGLHISGPSNKVQTLGMLAMASQIVANFDPAKQQQNGSGLLVPMPRMPDLGGGKIR
jgi:hypothetical protein